MIYYEGDFSKPKQIVAAFLPHPLAPQKAAFRRQALYLPHTRKLMVTKPFLAKKKKKTD